jgi:hypothetical protein
MRGSSSAVGLDTSQTSARYPRHGYESLFAEDHWSLHERLSADLGRSHPPCPSDGQSRGDSGTRRDPLVADHSLCAPAAPNTRGTGVPRVKAARCEPGPGCTVPLAPRSWANMHATGNDGHCEAKLIHYRRPAAVARSDDRLVSSARFGTAPTAPSSRIRLEAQDTALSRRRSPVRIRYAVPALVHGRLRVQIEAAKPRIVPSEPLCEPLTRSRGVLRIGPAAGRP